MSTPLSRRAWLRTTSLGVGAGLLLPNPLAAAVPNNAVAPSLLEHARGVERARARAGAVRLSSNENPYGMSPKAKQAFMDTWGEHNRYGSPQIASLKAAFAKHIGLPADHVMVTQGSQEVLCTAALAFGGKSADILAADPTFEALPRYATAMGLRVHRVPLTDAMVHDLDAMDRRYKASIGLVFVCNPNNPTGTLAPNDRLRDYVSSTAARTMVLVDEAYHDFVTDPSYRSTIDLVQRGENVIVLRTASKIHGLAGCRIGFAVARPDIITQMEGFVTGPPNALAAGAAIAALADTEWQDFCRARNTEARDILTKSIASLGRKQAPSNTNFVFFHAGRPVAEVQSALEQQGFLVGRAFPPYNDWVRVSVGTPDEMRTFATKLPGALKV